MAVQIKGVRVGEGSSPKIMGVLNISPESFFSDSFTRCDEILVRALEMMQEGADMIDLGARSTALTAPPLSVSEERERVVAALRELDGCGAVLSLDTMHPEVLDAALRYDIAAINDINGLGNPLYAKIAADSGLPVIAMAAGNRPGDPVDFSGTLSALRLVCERAERFGISDLILDPGVGKWVEERSVDADWELCRRFSLLQEFERPLLAAVSRKAFIGNAVGKPAEERLFGTLGVLFFLLEQGADIVRVHDVLAVRDVVLVFERLL
ncbi:dihydropteroate synthase [Methanorbis rubei]|uniref:dihydropteroate synthase n=1 Tax=Methanorbis rubei TaxID=3028300 RepID=A0AAE4MG53_9EURY|nr:Dihydropteroate synthase [Methanocorpusculaceae archaeon Cs1]